MAQLQSTWTCWGVLLGFFAEKTKKVAGYRHGPAIVPLLEHGSKLIGAPRRYVMHELPGPPMQAFRGFGEAGILATTAERMSGSFTSFLAGNDFANAERQVSYSRCGCWQSSLPLKTRNAEIENSTD